MKANRSRRRLYTQGALMVLAPIGVASCGGSSSDPGVSPPISGNDASTDATADQEAAVPDAPPEVIAVVPYDAYPDALLVAPTDAPDPSDAELEATVDAVMIAPKPDAEADAGEDGPVFDAKPEAGLGETCQVDDDCQAWLFCEQAICIVACDPKCQNKPCDPQNPSCPVGSSCELVGLEYQCLRK